MCELFTGRTELKIYTFVAISTRGQCYSNLKQTPRFKIFTIKWEFTVGCYQTCLTSNIGKI
jgi:hypothetical protein